MNIFEDIIYVNKYAIKKTFKSLSKNWMLFFVGIVYSALSLIVFGIVNTVLIGGPMSLLSGTITLVITSGFISSYLYLLYNVINYNRMTFQNFKDGFSYFLGKIYSVFFLGYLFTMIIRLIGASQIMPIIGLIGFIALNPIAETIYLKSYSASDTIIETFEFMKSNWLNWILPGLVAGILLYGVSSLTGNGMPISLNIGISYSLSFIMEKLTGGLLSQIAFTIVMVYRGHLYKLLSTGNRRKRSFMSEYK